MEPFSGKPAIDPTEAMKKQNYTVRKMFQVRKLTNIKNIIGGDFPDGGRLLCSDGVAPGAGLLLETLNVGEAKG